MLYASYQEKQPEGGAAEAPSAAPGAEPGAAPAAGPHTAAGRAEDAVDQYWAKQDGTIVRGRDPQFCRHGSKGMCDYCMPLEPYDTGYHAQNNIKHLSFHAYLRQQNVSRNTSSSTYVPPLEPASYRVRVPCPSGQHAPWPAGVCTKCQPSAITLQRQTYRMVDHVEFAHPHLIETMLDIWRKTNAQRFGFLVGRYEPYPVVPMGVKAVVETIHEPPQHGDIDGLQLGVPWEDQGRIEQLAAQCGLQILGMIYTDLEAADPTHEDPDKVGLVACKRHTDSYFLSGAEAVFAAQMQNANTTPSRFSRTHWFNSRFVTCALSGTPEGAIDVAAYQVSEQAMGMVDAGIIEPSVDPAVIRVRASTPEHYVPEVFYRYKNKYGIDVKESAKPVFPVEYLIVNVTHGFPTAPTPRFLSHKFPVENRPGLHDQDLGKLLGDLAVQLGDAELLPGGGSPQLRAELVRFLSDWHMLAFLGHAGILDDGDMAALARVATTHDEGAALDELVARPGWQTLVALAREHAPEPAAEAPSEAPAPPPSAAEEPSRRAPPARAPERDPARENITFDGLDSDDEDAFQVDDDEEEPQPAQPAADEHACPHCTFHNPPGRRDCEVCGLPL